MFLGYIGRTGQQESIQGTVQFSAEQSVQMQHALTEARQYISDAANAVMRNHPDQRISSARMVQEMRAYIHNPHNQFGGRDATPEGRQVALEVLNRVRTSATQRNPEGTTFTGVSEARLHLQLRDEIIGQVTRLAGQVERIARREFGAGANLSAMNPTAHPLTYSIARQFLTSEQQGRLPAQPSQVNRFQPQISSQPSPQVQQQQSPQISATMDTTTYARFNRPGVSNADLREAPYVTDQPQRQEMVLAAAGSATSLARNANQSAETTVVSESEAGRALREAMTRGSSTLTLNHSSSSMQFMQELQALAARNGVEVTVERGQFNTIHLILNRVR